MTPEIIEIRHHLHQHPELSNREVETGKFVAAYLTKLGLEVRYPVAHTGVVAILEGGKPGPVVAVRADMDALPVTEDTPYPFKSTVRATYLGQEVGVSHACGHDIHTAALLGVAKVLTAMRSELPGTVKFIFQPAEEGVPEGEEGGAPLMVKEGALDQPRPQAIFGLHTWAGSEVGEVKWTAGPALASSDRFRIVIKGRQAHGALPHLSVDPVVTAAQAVLALQTIPSRNVPPLEPTVLTVGIIQGGTRFNIIPDQVELAGTVRTYNPAMQDLIERRMHEVLKGITESAGATYELTYERINPVTINDTTLTAWAAPRLARLFGPGRAGPMEPWMAAEDFSIYARLIPGFFFRVGVVKPGTVSGGHHTPTFMADDSSLPVAMRAMSNLIVEYLRNPPRAAVSGAK
ncbi:MAG: M20 metallopeptidase family protein [Gemmatimonadota bacterium]